ncbi:MAG: hypothetical protein HYY65_13935 [Candidatus Tectomicrobia bacterium]|uniref:Uncharacterized protein n=1 Tax=Tectimicrobiota bacterium TaxID=2528274 RepID=A0A932GS30_UNCTE|nr:hypothetical protein [Candidatus Tectomicrobia bacterium]
MGAKKGNLFAVVICKWCGGQPVDLVEKFYPKYPSYSITRRVEVLCRKCADKFIETECASGYTRISLTEKKLGEIRTFFDNLTPGEIHYNLLDALHKLISPPDR